jgi:cytochrome c553
MKKMITILIMALSLTLGTSAFAGGDVAAGKTKAAVCAGCHGVAGISASPMWPNLAGQKEMYLVKQIKAFKNGTRKDPTMAPMVAALTDADINNIAAYFASLK